MEPQDRNLRGQQRDRTGEPAKPLQNFSGAESGGMEELGFRQGKLFSGSDRLTLTFFMGDEVASIHFDLSRREIFFKGHNVKNMSLSQEQWLSLKKFNELIKREHCDPIVVRGYEECLAQILPRL